VNRLRNRLIAAFAAATLIPLAVTVVIVTGLIDRSLNYATTEELDRISESLRQTGVEYYQLATQALKTDALAGSVPKRVLVAKTRNEWPVSVMEFAESGEPERFEVAGTGGGELQYLVRHGENIWVYTRPLGEIRMDVIGDQYKQARELVDRTKARDLRRGFIVTLFILVAAVWVVSLAWLVYLAHRMSKPIQQLTAGLTELAAGNLATRIPSVREDEVGRAIAAFNRSAEELQQSRERLVYLTQIASWQTLARKMAHELKNSLTPIRLTVEEMVARQPPADRQFADQASKIVVDEIEALERRVRAFSEFSAEPALRLGPLDVNELLGERVAFLRTAHPGMEYQVHAGANLPAALGDADRVKGILTNLIENAAEAAGEGGRILGKSYTTANHVVVEIHDSGPGLSPEALKTLFEPTISFKARGMGLGLSIARKDALVCGGDLLLIPGEMGGAGFRLILPKAPKAWTA
jgi:nitrogen fixation/metabolism regulation signal transduction histidine kinase